MKLSTAVLPLVAGALLVGCASPVAFEYSDDQTILNAMSGKTVIGSNDLGESYCEYHDPNGGVFGRDTEVYAGNWRVTTSDYICYSYPGFDEDCQRALVTGNRVRLMTPYGGLLHQGTLVDGNVCS